MRLGNEACGFKKWQWREVSRNDLSQVDDVREEEGQMMLLVTVASETGFSLNAAATQFYLTLYI